MTVARNPRPVITAPFEEQRLGRGLRRAQQFDFARKPVDFPGQVTLLIRHRRCILPSSFVVRCRIDGGWQGHWLGKEEPIAEKELLAEDGVKQRIGEASVSEGDAEAQVVTEGHWPNKRSPTKQAGAHHPEPAGGRRHMKPREVNLDGPTEALYGAHLPCKAWRESRSRQENHYGRHAVHILLRHRSGAAAKKRYTPGGVAKKDISCRSREMSQKCKNSVSSGEPCCAELTGRLAVLNDKMSPAGDEWMFGSGTARYEPVEVEI